MTEKANTRLTTGIGRASYVNVFKPRLNELNGKEEFGLCFLLPKTDTDTLARIKKACAEAAAAKWGARLPSGLQMPWHDGDGPKPNGGDYGEECKGMWVFNVKSLQRPGLVDVNVQPILDPSQFVSGYWCRVSVNAFAYDNKKKGVSLGLNNIQVVRADAPLGSRSRPEDDFQPDPAVAGHGDEDPFA